MFSFLLGMFLEMELLGHIVAFMVNLLGNCRTTDCLSFASKIGQMSKLLSLITHVFLSPCPRASFVTKKRGREVELTEKLDAAHLL